ASMEAHFGYDFGGVRVHTDDQAADSARAVNALAYTVGRSIVFGSGQYAPQSAGGRSLLAHELAHVVQQGGAAAGRLEIAPSTSAAERQADRAADRAVAGGFAGEVGAAPVAVARQEAGEAVGPAAQGQGPAAEGAAPVAGSGCTPGAGITNSTCSAYLSNLWWLPNAYVNNATCACTATPNVATANCVRKFLQDRLAATPTWLKVMAASQKPLETANPPAYLAFVQSFLTPRIYQDHVDAYRACC